MSKGMAPTGQERSRGRGLLRPPRFHRAKSDNEAMALPQRTMSKQQREPPPSLFLHPSPAASHVSLPGILAPGATVSGPSALTRQRSTHEGGSSSLAPNNGPRSQRVLKSTESTRSADRTDALWTEMQATLEEIELSASGGTHVFGPEHDRKLGDLRAAQIALAQAWARSEADETIETMSRYSTSATADELGTLKAPLGDTARSGAGDGTDAAKSTAASTSVRPDSLASRAEGPGARLEEETEVDIIMARRRREANDQYFQRVNNGVLDVVAKLEEVAVAMRAVEQETKDVWEDSEITTGSLRNPHA